MKTILTLCAVTLCGAFTLQAADAGKPKKAGEGKRNPEEIFKKLDSNGDGAVTKDEYLAGPRGKQDPVAAAEQFKTLDKNNDGKLSLEEFKDGGPAKGAKAGDAKK